MAINRVIKHPLQLFSSAHIKDDFSLITEGTVVLSDLLGCHFEKPYLDYFAQCKSDPDSCKAAKVSENLTKNMVLLMGKASSGIADLKGLSSSDLNEVEETTHQLGGDFGGVFRILSNRPKPKKYNAYSDLKN